MRSRTGSSPCRSTTPSGSWVTTWRRLGTSVQRGCRAAGLHAGRERRHQHGSRWQRHDVRRANADDELSSWVATARTASSARVSDCRSRATPSRRSTCSPTSRSTGRCPPGYGVRASHQTDGVIDDVLVCIPLPGVNRYRMSMLVPDDLATPKAAEGEVAHGIESGRSPELHHIQAVLDRLSPQPTKASNMRWSSVFRISHRLVDRYGVGQGVRRRRCCAHPPADRGPRHEHGPPGRLQPGLEAGPRRAGRRLRRPAGLATTPNVIPVGEEVVGRTVRNAAGGGRRRRCEPGDDDAPRGAAARRVPRQPDRRRRRGDRRTRRWSPARRASTGCDGAAVRTQPDSRSGCTSCCATRTTRCCCGPALMATAQRRTSSPRTSDERTRGRVRSHVIVPADCLDLGRLRRDAPRRRRPRRSCVRVGRRDLRWCDPRLPHPARRLCRLSHLGDRPRPPRGAPRPNVPVIQGDGRSGVTRSATGSC